MPIARIFRPDRSATQSGRARSQHWELVFEPSAARSPDPLMGWTETTDTAGQVRLRFETREEAVAFAQRNGLTFEVSDEQRSRPKLKAYADNFAFRRREPWTH